MKSVSPDVHLIVRSCPLFVPMIEEGIEDRQVIEPIIRYYLYGVIGQVDTLLLGCTHYPLIKQYIGDIYHKEKLTIIDSAESVANSLEGFITQKGFAGQSAKRWQGYRKSRWGFTYRETSSHRE